MTDKAHEAVVAALAEALLAALKGTGYLLTHEYADGGVLDVAHAQLAALTPEARDAMLLGPALAELERALPERYLHVELLGPIHRDKGEGPMTDEWNEAHNWRIHCPGTIADVSFGPTPLAAVNAALEALDNG